MAEEKSLSEIHNWLGMSPNFFDREDIKLIECENNGDEIIIFYISLLLKGVLTNGVIQFKENIPYSKKQLSILTDIPENLIDYCIETLLKYCLINVDKNGIITLLKDLTYTSNTTRLEKRMSKNFNLKNVCGIYRLYNEDLHLIYIGKSYDLFQRISTSSYQRQAYCYDYCVLDSRADTDIYELFYINKYKPPLNADSNSNDKLTVTLPLLKFCDKILVNKRVVK